MMVEPEKDAAALAERMRMTTRCGDDNVERKVTATASSTLDGTDATTTLQQCKEGVAHTADSKSSHIVDAHPPFVGDVSEEPLPSAKKDDATIGEENDNENDSSSSSSVDDDPGNHFYSIDPNGMVTASSASSTHPASVMLDCNNNNSMDGVEEEGELAETASDIMSRTSSVRSALDATEVRSHAYNLLQRLAGPRAATSGSNETEEPSHVNPNGAKSLPSNGDGLREKRPYSKTTLLCIILSIVVILTGLIVTVAVLARNKKDNGSDESLPDNDVNNPFFPPTVSPAPTTSFETTSTECQSLLERPRVQQFEAEDAVAFLGNATTSTKTYNNATGYCGSGYGILSDAGDRVVVGYVTTDSSGYYTFTVRYSTSIQAELIVSLNSVPVAFLTMNATKSTGSWTIVTVSNMLLHEGSHYLEVWIQKDHVPNVHIDWIALTNDVPLSKSEYLTQLLKEDYGIDGGMEWHQNASLSWMAMEDTLDWTTVSSRELVERYVLAQFYMATYGEVWNSQAGWLSSRHVCDWYGIICVSTNGTIKTDNLVTDVVLGKSRRIGDDGTSNR